MTAVRWAWVLLIGGIAMIVTYEFVAIAKGWLTITQIVQRASAKSPAVPFFFGLSFGLLFGHFFL